VFETAGVVQHTHFKLFFIGFKLVQRKITNFVRLKNLAPLIKKLRVKHSSNIRLTIENLFKVQCSIFIYIILDNSLVNRV
jgi:hypothetical protein